jgi:hypothetical protein
LKRKTGVSKGELLVRIVPSIEELGERDGDSHTILVIDDPKPVNELLPACRNDWSGAWVMTNSGEFRIHSVIHLLKNYRKL